MQPYHRHSPKLIELATLVAVRTLLALPVGFEFRIALSRPLFPLCEPSILMVLSMALALPVRKHYRVRMLR